MQNLKVFLLDLRTARFVGLLTAFHIAVFNLSGEPLSAIPEPGLVVYGTVAARGLSAFNAPLIWQIWSASSTNSVLPTIVTVNGQSFHITYIPFETRQVSGLAGFRATPNRFELLSEGAIYSRAATVDGKPARLSAPAGSNIKTDSFFFGPADRGKVERIDVELDSVQSGETFEQWLQRHGLPTDSDRDSDPLNKGMTLYEEFVAGTNPNDRNSVFRANSTIVPDLAGGLTLNWSSVVGKKYSIQRTTSIDAPFVTIRSAIVAAEQSTSFRDVPPESKTLFYRIQLDEGK